MVWSGMVIFSIFLVDSAAWRAVVLPYGNGFRWIAQDPLYGLMGSIPQQVRALFLHQGTTIHTFST